jgi:glycosyltransferase involved in cell wall biosynthesis
MASISTKLQGGADDLGGWRVNHEPLSLARSTMQSRPARQLLVDVSNIARNDARTGIQRVVRAMASALQQLDASGFDVRLIASDRHTSFRYLPDDFLEPGSLQQTLELSRFPAVQVAKGDVFLGLDLTCSTLPHHDKTLIDWRRRGVNISIFLYDLLPMTSGRWFSLRMRFAFRRWLRTVERRADRIVAISQTVAEEFNVLRLRGVWRSRRNIVVRKLELGSDIPASLPTTGVPEDAHRVLDWLQQPTVLMVGTVEPRKGYAQALDAFAALWTKSGPAPQLLVIGRRGWKTDRLQQRMRELERTQAGFRWLDSVSDEFLEQIYQRVSGLLMASQAEGFGLPIVEALAHGCPVLARDLAVFRELEGRGISFFHAGSAEALAESLANWLSDAPVERLPQRRAKKWHDAAVELAGMLQAGIEDCATGEQHPRLREPRMAECGSSTIRRES